MPQPKYPVRSLLRPIVDWFGRLGKKNAPTVSVKCKTTAFGASETCLTQKSDTDLWDMFFTPYIWAGVRFRDLSGKWTGASPTKDEAGQLTSPAQVQSLDLEGNEVASEQLDATRWLFDSRLHEGTMAHVLKEICYAKLLLKKSVHEILWVKETEGDYAGKFVIDGFKHVDPTLFEYNPQGYEPGLYVQRVNDRGVRMKTFEPVDERRFLIVTNQRLFADKNGISELEPLRDAEPRRADAEKSWGRGAQRHGHGHIIGYYGSALLGASAETERTAYQTALREMGSDTITMIYGGIGADDGNRIEQLNVEVDADVFREYIDELKSQISVVLTGSPLTLKEGKFGSRSMAESTQVRQEAGLEQRDAAEISVAFTEQVIRRFCDFNWLQTDIYPKMQLISEEYSAPTTPDSQDLLTEEQPSSPSPIAKEALVKLQAEDEEENAPTPPVAIPAGYEHFPETSPNPEIYQTVAERAKAILADFPVKRFQDLNEGESKGVFSIKQLRSFDNELSILIALRDALIPTLDAPTEADAWKAYYDSAIAIFQQHGINMTPTIRTDLLVSFRQARQTAVNQAIKETPDVIGFRIKAILDDRTRPISRLWADITLPKHDPRWEVLDPPSDFGDRGWLEPVYNLYDLTPESEIPTTMPGETYKYYIVGRQAEAQ